MDYKVIDINSSEKEVEIKLVYDEIKTELEDEVKKQTKKIQLPGFRKGKAPVSMIKKMYGDALEYEASEKIANSFFWKVADEKGLKPIGQPSMTNLNFEPEKELSFKVRFESFPALDVKDYLNINIDLPDLNATDEEIQKEIDYIIKSNKTLEETDSVSDVNTMIDAEITLVEKNGSVTEDAKPEKMTIDLTAEGIAKEIITNAMNKKTGESFSFSYKDEHSHKHEDGSEEIHKEEFKYEVKILGLKKVILPELNEELIKKVTKEKQTTVTGLKEDIKNDIQRYYDQQSEELLRVKLISEIIKANDFTPPKSFVENILEEYVKTEEEQSKKSRHPFNKDEARKRLQKSAETEVKWYLIRSEILKKENLSVTDEDLKELAEKESVTTGLPVEKLINYYQSSGQKDKLLDKKLFEYLKSKSKINKVDPSKLKSNKEDSNE